LEKAFATAFALPEAVWFPYARVAIQAWLEVLGLQGRGVVFSPFNCVALGNAVRAAGAHPVYVDTEAGGFNQDADQMLSALARPQAGAAVVVSLWGIPCALPLEVPKPLLYDHALRGLDPAGAPPLRADDAVVYSLGWGKPLSSQRGALLCAGSPDLNTRLRAWRDGRLRAGRWTRDFGQALLLRIAFSPPLFRVTSELDRLGAGAALSGKEAVEGARLLPGDWNVVPSDAVFDFGCAELGDLPNAAGERARQVSEYARSIGELQLPSLDLPPAIPWLSHFPVRHPARDEIARRMRRNGFFVSTSLFSQLLCDHSWLAGERVAEPVRARGLTRSTLHLPLFRGLTQDQQRGVLEALARSIP
jgi:hypothetical protein